MHSKFKLEIDVVLDTDAAPSVIEVARLCYAGARATTSTSRERPEQSQQRNSSTGSKMRS